MTITGKQLIAGEWVVGSAGQFHSLDPSSGKELSPAFSIASEEQAKQALTAAKAAANIFKNTSISKRAEFLYLCAEHIMGLGDALLERVTQETGYPQARAIMERGRTCGQLRMFADDLKTGRPLDLRIDTALPDREPLPRPDLRHMKQAIGPVAVFGASNFPLAFSVAGGDTASALAAGCPVIVKGHPSHPGTCELVAQAITKAAVDAKLPSGVFSMLMDQGHAIGAQLVCAPEIKAVGFTGSFNGGNALVKLASERPQPIPVFVEMGSVNPVFLMPEALGQRSEQIAQGFVGSITLGSGQFCVKPGLVMAVNGDNLQSFIDHAKQAVEQMPSAVLLNNGICNAYGKGIDRYREHEGIEVLATGNVVEQGDGCFSQVTLLKTSANYLLQNPELLEETFGPVSIIVSCESTDDMFTVAKKLDGQLTATVHCAENELKNYPELIDELQDTVGRIVINGFPTGVEVCHAMVHGGPFPATSDSRFTSVGSNAIQRFLRPVCLQNYPAELLPEPLANKNPLKLERLVNGVQSTGSLND